MPSTWAYVPPAVAPHSRGMKVRPMVARPVRLMPTRSARVPIRSRKKAPPRGGTATISPFWNGLSCRSEADVGPEPAEEDPHHERDVEVDEGGRQTAFVAGRAEAFRMHDASQAAAGVGGVAVR